MKTAVSIPDELFHEAERVADERGMTRSGLYAEALRRMLEDVSALRRMSDVEVTRRVNATYGSASNELDPVLATLQFEALGNEDWTDRGELKTGTG